MRFDRLPPDAIEADWERIGRLLCPAIAHDEKRMAIDVYRDLMTGALELFDVDLWRAKGVAVTEIALTADTHVRCLWVVYIGGAVTGAKREWIGRMRALMTSFEGIARAEGCAEMRIEGRDWSRIFPDWEPMRDRPGRNELRKVLA